MQGLYSSDLVETYRFPLLQDYFLMRTGNRVYKETTEWKINRDIETIISA